MTTRWRRVAATAAAAALAGASVGLTVSAVPAGAALSDLTAFAIDGNAQGPNDWEAPYAALRDLTIADDVCDINPVVDPDTGEEVTDEPDRVVPGNKLDDIDLDSPPVDAGNVNRKSDICRVYRAWEIVRAPGDLGSDQYQIIFYGAWARPNVNGELNVLFTLLGPDPTSNDDDIIINYDFVDSTDTTTVDVLTWDGSTWVSTAVPAYVDVATARGQTVEGIDDPVTFGEFAINLTLSGFLPEGGPCTDFSGGAVLSRTGNSPNATLMDYAGFGEPLLLTNCGAIEVVKEAVPTPVSETEFGFTISQDDGAPVLAGDVASVSDTIVVPPNPSSVLTEDLLISPDYLVAETTVPSGWELDSLVCTAEDPLTQTTDTYVLAPGEPAPFPVGPWSTAVCEIVNIGPPTLTLEKVTLTGAGGPFRITVTDDVCAQTDHVVDLTTIDPEVPVAGAPHEMMPAVPYTITETGFPDAFTPVGYVCEVYPADGGEPAVLESEDPVTLTFEQGDEAYCLVANRLLESDVFIVKEPDATVDPGTEVTFTLLVGNNGPDAAQAVTVTDTFPAGLTPTAVVDDGPYTCALDGQTLTCTIAEHPVDVDAEILVTALVAADAAPAATYVNTAVVENLTPPDVDETNNEDSATVTVTAADLVVQKTPDGGTYAPGAAVTWTITVQNKGPDDATSATLTDTFPSSLTGLTVVDDGPYACSLDGQVLSCTIASHPAEVTATITVRGTIAASALTGTRITNTASVTSVTPDLVPADNADTGYVDVLVLPKTGADVGSLASAALGLVLAGTALIAASRRVAAV